MEQMPKSENPNNKEIFREDRFQFLLSIISIEGLICIIWLLLIPKDTGGIFFGFSLRRLLLVSIPLFFTILSLAILFLRKKNPLYFNNFIARLNFKNTLKFIYPFTVILSIITWSSLFFYHLLNYEINPFINQRLLPISVWINITSLSLIIILTKIFGKKEEKHKHLKIISLLPFFLLAIILFGIIYLTGLGLYTKDVTVNDLAVPLLEWQIIYICGLMIIIIFTKNGFEKINILQKEKRARFLVHLSLLIFIFLWLTASVIWIKLPLPNNNYFAPEKLPPNFETYPFSDAEKYSLEGQRIISGAIDGFIISKPLHAVFLAFTHSIGGLDYEKVILVQTLILALFPAILYLIGKEIHGNILGLGMGLFAIFREVNAIQASDIANVSNSKLLMSDFPSTLILSILILITIKWIKKPDGKYFAVLLGGILGALALYRAQYLIFLPFFITMAFILYRKEWRSILVFSCLFLVCLSSTILPVLIRNYSISGTFWFDSPDYISSFRDNYVYAGEDKTNSNDIHPSASTAEIQLSRFLNSLRFLLKSGYAYDIADNFSRNIISTFLIFPVRFDGKQTLRELSLIEDNFWAEAYSYNEPLNLIIAITNLLFLVFGLSSLFMNNRKIGYSCIAFYVLINISTSAFRFSGWRFIMPVDWIIYLIYLLGFISILNYLHLIPQNNLIEVEDIPKQKKSSIDFNHQKNLTFILLFLLIGSLIPLRELFPVNYQTREKSEICENIDELISNDKYKKLKENAMIFCQDDSSFAVEGNIIHPRFFHRGQGFYDRPGDVFFGKQDFSRLVFRVLSEDARKMYIPVDDLKKDEILPNGAHAIILAKIDELPEAQFLVLTDGKQIHLYR
jgi:hypothetical protein